MWPRQKGVLSRLAWWRSRGYNLFVRVIIQVLAVYHHVLFVGDVLREDSGQKLRGILLQTAILHVDDVWLLQLDALGVPPSWIIHVIDVRMVRLNTLGNEVVIGSRLRIKVQQQCSETILGQRG